MSDEIILRRDGVAVIFSEPRRDRKGWLESYAVTLEAVGVSANVRVQNPPYGSSPVPFVADLVGHWRGWKGQKTWRSMEGELDLVAVSDPLGHITITAQVRPDAHPSVWSARLSVVVEAGQLTQLDRQFESFFAGDA